LTSATEGHLAAATEKKQIPLTEPRQATSTATSRAAPLFGSNSASADDTGGGRSRSSSEEDRGSKAHGRTLTRLTQVVRTVEKDSQGSAGPSLALEAGEEGTLGYCVFGVLHGESQRSASRPPPSPERYARLARNTHTPRHTHNAEPDNRDNVSPDSAPLTPCGLSADEDATEDSENRIQLCLSHCHLPTLTPPWHERSFSAHKGLELSALETWTPRAAYSAHAAEESSKGNDKHAGSYTPNQSPVSPPASAYGIGIVGDERRSVRREARGDGAQGSSVSGEERSGAVYFGAALRLQLSDPYHHTPATPASPIPTKSVTTQTGFVDERFQQQRRTAK
jgi:hypothetical protein